jgi:ABC-type Mn2+/Zn2+ transport system permease subunit
VNWLLDPWAWWVEPFVDNAFMRDALVAGLLTVVTTSMVGTWVVLRGMSFLGDALAHGVLPGIAIAFIAGQNTTLGALIAAGAMVGGISLIRSHSPLPDDASIGVLFVGFLALAVVIMSTQRASYTGDLNRFLFGSVAGVTSDDITRQAIAAAVAIGGVVVFYRAFLVMTFDETLARLLGLRPRLANAVLLALVAIAIVSSFESVGNLLVFAFLVAPPAAACLIGRRVPSIMLISVGLGSLAAVIGLLVSWHHSTAAGATMALASVIVFFGVLAISAVVRATRERSHPGRAHLARRLTQP